MSGRWALSFLRGEDKFNYRVAGVIIRRGHVLVCREDRDDFVYLPGGRVEIGEASDVSLAREIREELHCAGDVGRLLYSVENFFELEGVHFHEIGKYYTVNLPDDFPFPDASLAGESTTDQAPAFVSDDEGHVLRFYWVKIEPDALAGINLLPVWIRARLDDLPLQTEHLIVDER